MRRSIFAAALAGLAAAVATLSPAAAAPAAVPFTAPAAVPFTATAAVPFTAPAAVPFTATEAVPFAAPPAADAAAQQELGSDYTYSTGIPWPQSALWTPEQVLTQVADNFRSYFPFDSNCEVIRVGSTCDLYSLGTSNPVLVTARTATGFQFRSLPGHAEGADRWINFEFYATGSGAQLDIRLRATAGGPYTVAAELTILSGAAYEFWSQFATNVGARFGG